MASKPTVGGGGVVPLRGLCSGVSVLFETTRYVFTLSYIDPLTIRFLRIYTPLLICVLVLGVIWRMIEFLLENVSSTPWDRSLCLKPLAALWKGKPI